MPSIPKAYRALAQPVFDPANLSPLVGSLLSWFAGKTLVDYEGWIYLMVLFTTV
jgi:hypothetical protein